MSSSKKILAGILLLAGMTFYDAYSMKRQRSETEHSKDDQIATKKQKVESKDVSAGEIKVKIFQELKSQLLMTIFIMMRVDSIDYDEDLWKEQDVHDCCKSFSTSKSISYRDKNRYKYENNSWTDLYFVQQLLEHLDELSVHVPCKTNSFMSVKNRQILAEMAYELYYTLSSLYPPTHSKAENNFASALSEAYLAEESFDSFIISIENIRTLLDMSKVLLLKLLNFKFLRSYPCGFERKRRCRLGKGYLKREEFLNHYITTHCHSLEYNTIYSMLRWFREQSKDESSQQVYDYILNKI